MRAYDGVVRRRGVSAAQPPTSGWSPGIAGQDRIRPSSRAASPISVAPLGSLRPGCTGGPSRVGSGDIATPRSALARRMWHGFGPASSMSRSAPTATKARGQTGVALIRWGERQAVSMPPKRKLLASGSRSLCPHRRSTTPPVNLIGVRRNLGSRAPRGARRELARADLARTNRLLDSPARTHRWHDLSRPRFDEVRDRLEDTPSGFGRLTAVRHAAVMTDTRPRWGVANRSARHACAGLAAVNGIPAASAGSECTTSQGLGLIAVRRHGRRVAAR
jgi:hypothetical protein